MEKNDTKITIPIDEPSAAFEKHLGEEKSARILFSGEFGIGKTYFLKEFFKKREDEYFMLRVCPINYAVVSNEDVLQFLRFDILSKLLIHDKLSIDFIDEDFNEFDFIYTYLYQYLPYLLLNMLPFIPKGGKAAKNAIEKFNEFFENLNAKREEYQSTPEGKAMSSFFENVNHHYLKQDTLIDEIIRDNITRIKEETTDPEEEEGKEKKTVLVIDDIDRMDPGHIFRLFNLFSAHFDQEEDLEANYLGFDHVVMVCHYENIRSIFHARYGERTDFSGYMDKFFHQRVFYFDNREGIVSKVRSILEVLPYPEKLEREFGAQAKFIREFSILLTDCILASVLNIRKLLQIDLNQLSSFSAPISFLKDQNDNFIDTTQFYGIILYQLLEKILGPKDIKEKINQVIDYLKLRSDQRKIGFNYRDDDGYLYKELVKYLVLIIGASEHRFKDSGFYDPTDDKRTYGIQSKTGHIFHFEIEHDGRDYKVGFSRKFRLVRPHVLYELYLEVLSIFNR